ncbi:unnamed protein product, partial [Ceratitis capitata]
MELAANGGGKANPMCAGEQASGVMPVSKLLLWLLKFADYVDGNLISLLLELGQVEAVRMRTC